MQPSARLLHPLRFTPRMRCREFLAPPPPPPAPAPASVLEFWAKGADISRVALYLEDSRRRQTSRQLQFSALSADLAESGMAVLDSDADGWMHMQARPGAGRGMGRVDKAAAHAHMPYAIACSLDVPQPGLLHPCERAALHQMLCAFAADMQVSLGVLATIPGTKAPLVADASGWDRIVIKDVSGAHGCSPLPPILQPPPMSHAEGACWDLGHRLAGLVARNDLAIGFTCTRFARSPWACA